MNFNFRTRLIIGSIAIAGVLFLQIPRETVQKDLTNADLENIISTVEEAFSEAEKKILGTNPDIPDDKPLVPDPDPEKCVCKGTGKIKQGDGHVTPCPYHGKKTEKCQCDTEDTYCDCQNVHGSCQCTKIKQNTTTSPRKSRILVPIFQGFR
tara:strand:- start:185 stop:640 length:456 start_codon:yes stop_codon:yes gene_type:complete